MREVRRLQSLEIFTLAVLFVALGSAWLTARMGLSLSLGAFLAGIMLGESKFRQQIEDEIRPFRDILLGIFFISVGMMFNIAQLPHIIVPVLLLLCTLFLFKTAVVGLLARVSGLDWQDALRTGLMLAQSGEFGFALFNFATNHALLPTEMEQPILGAILFSMIISPLIIHYQHSPRFNKFLQFKNRHKKILDEPRLPTLTHHTVLCGFGRVGQNIARILKQLSLPYVAFDNDPALVEQAKLAGEPIIYADVTQLGALKMARLSKASALIISFEEISAATHVLQQVRAKHKKLPVFVRTLDNSDFQELKKLGATEVIPSLAEESLFISTHLLQNLHIPTAKIQQIISTIRQKHYQLFDEVIPGDNPALSLTDRKLLHSVVLSDEAFAIGKSLGAFPDGLAAEITAIRRNHQPLLPLSPETVFQDKDVLTLYGTQGMIEQASHWLLRGFY
jgi:CPA2 family monovalent cation:H+ antiporter-2